jgi:hypothetical protein
MKTKKTGFDSTDEYIASFPRELQKKLEELRATIRAAAPDGKLLAVGLRDGMLSLYGVQEK